ncbi:hypothetical protein ACJ73_03060 [Blastomyces percursus]|uniref:Uncharacterized protein n=1 Tax=Blastomyces percursus TaxID=1658174 RepID=A0A1J9RD29_9EURO|nr:hypothetical protein ACJ73_03060 [Blastomyces percursus]
MRLTSTFLFGLLAVVAPLGAIADGILPTDTSEACALLANRTPEEFASTLVDLENQAKLDPTLDQAEVDEALAQIESLPIEDLQADVDKTCAAQAQVPTVSRGRLARRQGLGGVDAILPAGLGSTLGGLTGTAGPALGGLGVKKARNENARRQDIGGTVGDVTGALPGGLGDTVKGVVGGVENGAGVLSRRQGGTSLGGLGGILGGLGGLGGGKKKGGLLGGILTPGVL